MLARHEELIQKKAMFAHEGMVFMEMLYSDCLLVMFPGQRHVGIAARNEWNRPRLKALPPKDVEQAVAVLMQKYGRGGLKEAELFH